MKRYLDVILTVLLFVLMGYFIWGDALHQWAGILMLICLLIHHYLNHHWYKHLFHGSYSHLRILYVILNGLLAIDMILLMISGLSMATIFEMRISFIPVSLARQIHVIGSFWGFLLMAVHTGLHLSFLFSKKLAWILYAIGVYGIYALFHREFLWYMSGLRQFVFFDFSEPAFLFYFDYAAIFILGLGIGNLLIQGGRKRK